MASKINLAPTTDWITCALNVWQNSLKKPKTSDVQLVQEFLTSDSFFSLQVQEYSDFVSSLLDFGQIYFVYVAQISNILA